MCDVRAALFDASRQRLSELAHRAQVLGRSADDCVLVAIDVDDPEWTDLVDQLMPHHDWSAIRARGERPIARGSVVRDGIEEMLRVAIPDVSRAMAQPLPGGAWWAVVFASGGASLYYVELSSV